MSQSLGRIISDLSVENLNINNQLTGCNKSVINIARINTCELNALTINGNDGIFNNLVVNNINLPIVTLNPPRVFASATDVDPPIPLVVPGLFVDPSQFSVYEEAGITYTGSGQWTLSEPGLYEIVVEYELQNGSIPANTVQNLAVLSGGIRINLILLTHIVELIKVTTGPAITTAETTVYGRQYLRASAGDTVSIRYHATAVQGSQEIRHRSLSIRLVSP